jgi:hypothetical protein
MAIRGFKNWTITLLYAFIGWALCGVVMGIGLSLTSENDAAVIHAVAVPFIFFGLSLLYHGRFPHADPLQTATIFLSFVVVMDFFVVALLIQGNLSMFRSALGTWIPFALIFTSSYLTGRFLRRGN